jgi:hypothetical protein
VDAGGHITSLIEEKKRLQGKPAISLQNLLLISLECLKQTPAIQSDAEGRNKRDKGDVTTGDETDLEGRSRKRVKSC